MGQDGGHNGAGAQNDESKHRPQHKGVAEPDRMAVARPEDGGGQHHCQPPRHHPAQPVEHQPPENKFLQHRRHHHHGDQPDRTDFAQIGGGFAIALLPGLGQQGQRKGDYQVQPRRHRRPAEQGGSGHRTQPQRLAELFSADQVKRQHHRDGEQSGEQRIQHGVGVQKVIRPVHIPRHHFRDGVDNQRQHHRHLHPQKQRHIAHRFPQGGKYLPHPVRLSLVHASIPPSTFPIESWITRSASPS